MKILSTKKKRLLKEFVNFTCEICHKKQIEYNLQIHRINRGYLGGEYILRNIEVICKECHKKMHYNEF